MLISQFSARLEWVIFLLELVKLLAQTTSFSCTFCFSGDVLFVGLVQSDLAHVLFLTEVVCHCDKPGLPKPPTCKAGPRAPRGTQGCHRSGMA